LEDAFLSPSNSLFTFLVFGHSQQNRVLTSAATEDYFVWIAVGFASGIVWSFFGVETVGRTIKELDACFEAKFPPRASSKRRKILRNEGERITVKTNEVET